MQRGGQQQIPRPANVRPGGVAPWHDLDPSARAFGVAHVRSRLADHPPARRDHVGLVDARPAAVLIPVFEEHGEARIILTKRPETLPTHRGQIAFPGGKLDPTVDVDLAAAALREAHEEIGLEPAHVEIIAELDHIGTVVSSFSIAPFVGLLAARPAVTPAPGEVETVFDVGIGELLDDATWRAERWDMPWVDDIEMPFYELSGETVWGATARILTNLLGHLTERG